MLKRIIILLTATLFVSSCTPKKDEIAIKIRQHIDGIRIIDTHEHHGYPWKKKHNCFDIGMYMYADLVSAGMPEITDSMDLEHDPEVYWNHISPYLRYVRGTSYYRQFIKNLQIMYNLNSDELNKDDYLRISAQVDSNFKNYTPWLNEGLDKLKIDYMLVDRVWDPFNHTMEHEKFGYVFRFDQLVLDVSKVSIDKRISDKKILAFLELEQLRIESLDDYLIYIDSVFSVLQHNHVIALKMGLAYHRLLSFEKVDEDVAENIFVTKEKSKEQIKLLQDYIVNYLVNKAGSESLIVQIHTGYLHGNNSNLGNGQPLLLVPLFKRFPETKFVIFHGSYPWIGDFIAIGKEFTNVNLDLVWLPQLSQTAAKRGLHELLDAVPYSKICWGGDVGKIDETAGSLELAKETVTEVLTERIKMGIISESTALDICDCIFRTNAIRIYNLRNFIDP